MLASEGWYREDRGAGTLFPENFCCYDKRARTVRLCLLAPPPLRCTCSHCSSFPASLPLSFLNKHQKEKVILTLEETAFRLSISGDYKYLGRALMKASSQTL
ncbi:Ubiquitin-conjugating enzyme E2 Q2 [Manis javanica]|nr:Ubiquitin-conjugating enzyme E2 Q2 [Manis javanica]